MNRNSLKLWVASVVCGTAAFGGGCRFDSHAERGTALGATYGSILGAIIGHQSGHTEGGALLGAVAGGVTGNVIGDAKDERDAAAQASYAESRNSVTNSELIMMAQNGVADEVIVNSVRTRGGRLDLSPMAIVNLKNSGVSDKVILGIQEAAGDAPPPQPVYPANGRVQTSIVVIRPRPVVGVGIGFGHHHHHHGFHHDRW